MKKLIFITFFLSACQQQRYVLPEELANLQNQVSALSARNQQLEQNQTVLRQQLDEVSRARLVPAGVAESLIVNKPVQTLDDAIKIYRSGDIEKALQEFNKFLQSDEKVSANYWLSQAYYSAGNYDYALRYGAEFLRLAPNDERSKTAIKTVVNALSALGRTDDAKIVNDYGIEALKNQ